MCCLIICPSPDYIHSRCCVVPCRSDHLVWVHGGSPEGWMGHEHAKAGYQRRRLGHPELWEVTVTAGWVGSLPTAVCLRSMDLRASRDLEAELGALCSRLRFLPWFSLLVQRSESTWSTWGPFWQQAVWEEYNVTQCKYKFNGYLFTFIHIMSFLIVILFFIHDVLTSGVVQVWTCTVLTWISWKHKGMFVFFMVFPVVDTQSHPTQLSSLFILCTGDTYTGEICSSVPAKMFMKDCKQV